MRIFVYTLLILSGSVLLSACNDDNDNNIDNPPTASTACTVHCAP